LTDFKLLLLICLKFVFCRR